MRLASFLTLITLGIVHILHGARLADAARAHAHHVARKRACGALKSAGPWRRVKQCKARVARAGRRGRRRRKRVAVDARHVLRRRLPLLEVVAEDAAADAPDEVEHEHVAALAVAARGLAARHAALGADARVERVVAAASDARRANAHLIAVNERRRRGAVGALPALRAVRGRAVAVVARL
eukprot:6184400-Pleurochrysis_carterae.AAC.1